MSGIYPRDAWAMPTVGCAVMGAQRIGTGHPALRRALDLRRGVGPERDRFFLADGLWAQEAVVAAGVGVDALFWCPEAAFSERAAAAGAAVADRSRSVYEVSARAVERISERDRPDGLVSIVRQPVWDAEDVRLGESALVLVADGVESPGNLGTLVRALDGCGADCLVLTNRRTRMAHPKVFRGSHGMSLRVPWVEFGSVADAVGWLAERSFTVYLADTEDAVNYRVPEYRGRVAVVVGNERYGISDEWHEQGSERVVVPMLGSADSLNVAISASVLLYEARARMAGW